MNCKKELLMLPLLMLISASLIAQAYDAGINYMGSQRGAVAMEFNFSESVLSNAIEKKMEKLGFKGDEKKGITTYKGVILHEISEDKLDIYTKIESKGRDKCVVYLFASRGYDNFISPANDSSYSNHMKTFLRNISSDANNYAVDIEIAKKMEDVADAEKDLSRLTDSQKDLQKKKTDIDQKIVENNSNIEKQRVVVEKQKKLLEEIKGKKVD